MVFDFNFYYVSIHSLIHDAFTRNKETLHVWQYLIKKIQDEIYVHKNEEESRKLTKAIKSVYEDIDIKESFDIPRNEEGKTDFINTITTYLSPEVITELPGQFSILIKKLAEEFQAYCKNFNSEETRNLEQNNLQNNDEPQKLDKNENDEEAIDRRNSSSVLNNRRQNFSVQNARKQQIQQMRKRIRRK